MKNKINILALSVAAAMLVTGCKKDYLETASSVDVDNTLIFKTTESSKTALDGMYRITYSHAPAVGYASGTLHSDFGQKAYDIVNDLMGNDMVVHLQGYGWFNRDYQYTERAQVTDNRRPFTIWAYYYNLIKNANNIIYYVGGASGPQSDKDDIKGQALAMRAFCYYNLVNYFQQTYKGNETKPGVPLLLAPPYGSMPRGTVQQVYTQIVKDLTDAETLLAGKTQSHKSHIDLKVCQGIRARVALTMEDWPTAASYANKARTGFAPMSITDFKKGFNSIANPEWMWGAEVIVDQATIFASFFSHMDANAFDYAQLGGQKKITKDLFDKINANDVRSQVFKTTANTTNLPKYCQNKFRLANPSSWAGDYLYMRAAEFYLVEAEALARQGQDAAAKTILESLVKARYSAYTAPASGQPLLDEILLQRRIELWGEGFSLFDIKRLKQGLNRPTGSGNHGSPSFDPRIYTLPVADPQFLMKIPQKEIDANVTFTTGDQNP